MPHNGKGTHPHGLREARSRGLVGDHEVKATGYSPGLTVYDILTYCVHSRAFEQP